MAEFSTCRFNFGVDWNQHISAHCDYYRPNCSDVSELQIPAGVDFLGMFIGWTQTGATKVAPAPKADKEGLFITDAKKLAATPLWKAYIIAEGAKLANNLTDCNVGGGSGTLCEKGANYIRANRATILSQYKAYAEFAASKFGTTSPFIWALEPDFVQYTDGSQQGGGISYSDGKALLTDIITTIKTAMPNAKISMDISPWKDQSVVIPAMIPVDKIDYMNTSGGVSLPGSLIKDITSWSSVWGLTKKGMIADDGYGTAGVPTNPNAGWSDAGNLKARIADGVVGLYEAIPGSGWGTTIANLRSQLPELKTCNGTTPVLPKYTLTVTTPTNGTITLSPAGGSYDSGTSVSVTATASSSYTFAGFTGASTSTTSPVTVVMTGNKTIGATFSSASKPKYTLTVTTPVNGSIALSPAGGSYDSGTSVTVTATAAANYKFSAFSGASTSTTSPVTIVMTGNKTIAATFAADISTGPVKLTLSAVTNGTVTASPVMPTAGYARGTLVTLTATPSAGYEFAGWSGSLTTAVSPATITMDADKSIGATFQKTGSAATSLEGGDCSDIVVWNAWGLNNNGWVAKAQPEPGNVTNSVCYTKDNNYTALPDTTFKLTQKGIQLTAGTKYISFRARVEKRDDMRGQHPIGVRVLVGGTSAFRKSDSIPQDTVWHTFNYSFPLASAGVAQFDILLGGGNQLSWQGVLLDDIGMANAPLAVEPRTIRHTGVQVRYSKGALDIHIAQQGTARVALVSPKGRTVAELGRHDFGVSDLEMRPDAALVGLHLLVIRGEGWQTTVPVVLGN